MSLRVLEPGLFSLLVDGGRAASRGYGVSVGGAADRAAFALGNALLGNAADAVALEITLAGPVLQATCPITAVVWGAPFAIRTDIGTIPVGKTFRLAEGEILHLGGAPTQARGYLCVAGGFHTTKVLGSGTALAPLRRAEVLEVGPSALRTRFLREDPLGPPERPGVLRYLPGTHASLFDDARLDEREFKVSPASNRMGIRLQGPAFKPPEQELLSEPVCPGTVQVTRDGQCIILGVDGQTIGGYPRIAQVITADQDRFAQLRPGDRVRFQQVDLQTAEEAARLRRARVAEWVLRLQTAERFAMPVAH